MSRLLLISTDAHADAPGEVYLEYMERPFREIAYGQLLEDERRFLSSVPAIAMLPPELLEPIDDQGLIRAGRMRGTWDLKCRLEMDREGAVAEVLFPGAHTGTNPFLDLISSPCPPEWRDAGARAYHRWLIDHIGDAGKGRLFGIAYPGSSRNLDATLAEMRWAADHGFVGISAPGHVFDPELPPLYHRHWDPFWAACVDCGLVVTIHSGYGAVPGQVLETMALVQKYVEDGNVVPRNRGILVGKAVTGLDDVDAFAIPNWHVRRALWNMMLGGVFDRFPTLKVAPTEIRLDFIPAFLAELDRRFEAGDMPFMLRPSEYWRRNCYGGATNIKLAEVEMRHEIGLTQMMFGRDYPHPEGTWPNTWDWLRAAFRGVPEEEARLLLGENAVECYGLDRKHLAAIAQRIGPRPEDILGNYDVDPAYIENFNDRGQFLQRREVLDVEEMNRLLHEDIAGQVHMRSSFPPP